jgi:hypothetical protein
MGCGLPDPVTVFADEPIWYAIRKMAPRDLARLPVVSRQDANVLAGLISRSDILRAYQVGIMRKQQQYLMRERMVLHLGEDIGFVDLAIKYEKRGHKAPFPRLLHAVHLTAPLEKLPYKAETILRLCFLGRVLVLLAVGDLLAFDFLYLFPGQMNLATGWTGAIEVIAYSNLS